MRMKSIFLIISMTFISFCTLAQDGSQQIEMADIMRSNGKIYVVVAVSTIILTGLILYLFNLDRKISKLENEIKK